MQFLFLGVCAERAFFYSCLFSKKFACGPNFGYFILLIAARPFSRFLLHLGLGNSRSVNDNCLPNFPFEPNLKRTCSVMKTYKKDQNLASGQVVEMGWVGTPIC